MQQQRVTTNVGLGFAVSRLPTKDPPQHPLLLAQSILLLLRAGSPHAPRCTVRPKMFLNKTLGFWLQLFANAHRGWHGWLWHLAICRALSKLFFFLDKLAWKKLFEILLPQESTYVNEPFWLLMKQQGIIQTANCSLSLLLAHQPHSFNHGQIFESGWSSFITPSKGVATAGRRIFRGWRPLGGTPSSDLLAVVDFHSCRVLLLVLVDLSW